MAKRYQTYFGIPIPPFKEKKLGAGSTTIRFVLAGKVVSKKNNQQAIAVRGDAKAFLHGLHKEKGHITLDDALSAVDMVFGKMRGNDQYKDFISTFMPVILEQKKVWEQRLQHKGLSFPLRSATMSLRLYFKDKYITDTVNKQQTIQDLLIEAGIIANDDYKTLNPIYSASAQYVDELMYNISFISLSFKI